MAEVYLGEAESLQGFKKQVAIKRVLPQLAQNQKFIAMFLDEARIGLHLNHANVVQVFDIGVSKDTYFIVMEYVDGVNFKLILDVSQRRGQLLPVPQTVYILIEICKALSYAHELADEHGRLRGIVHRDVSPPNVLLSKRGEVKLVDFGLAKAVDQLETTDPGVIKGKFSYLSPEAVSQQEVDARADIFAAGILLWETLTNQRLFLGTNDFETIELVRRATVPSVIERNPHVPPALEQVVLRALARDRNHRFQSAREFGDALTEVLFSHAMKVSNFDIGALVTGMIHEEASPGEPSRIEKLIEEELLRFTTIDEDNNPVGSISPEIIDDNIGAQPLDFSSFEDPRTWAGEMLGEGGEPLGLNGDEPTIQQEPSEELKALMAEVGGILVDDGSAVIPGDLESQFEPDEESVNAQEPRKGSKVSVALKIILAILLIALLGVGATIALLLIQPP
jgi:serine/threonine-protein kinase